MEAPTKKKRGFAGMDPALVREISRKGGQAAHRDGVAHEFTHEEAQSAGRKGGRVTHERLRAKRDAEAKLEAEIVAHQQKTG